MPLVPPFGAVFMAFADPADVEEWLARTPDGGGGGGGPVPRPRLALGAGTGLLGHGRVRTPSGCSASAPSG